MDKGGVMKNNTYSLIVPTDRSIQNPKPKIQNYLQIMITVMGNSAEVYDDEKKP
jgi:hypothetical protein